jgi:hypothetical protein
VNIADVICSAGSALFGRPRSRREGDFILHRMRRILREFGSDLGNGVRLDQYYPSPAAVDPYHLARHAEFGDYIPPSTSVVMERCFATGREYLDVADRRDVFAIANVLQIAGPASRGAPAVSLLEGVHP